MTVGTITGPVFAAPDVGFRRPLNVVCNHQIEPPVLIVVKPPRAGGPATRVGDTRLGRNVGEGAIAIIVVKNGAAVSGHIQVGISIIIEVPDSHPLAVMSFAPHSGLFGDVGECSVAV